GYEFLYLNKTGTVHRNTFVVADATDGTLTVNLPPVAKGLTVIVKKVDGNNDVTVSGHSSEQIDGSSTLVLQNQYDSVTLISDGTEWHALVGGAGGGGGSPGADGADGVNGSGLAFTYEFDNSTTSSDPGSGLF